MPVKTKLVEVVISNKFRVKDARWRFFHGDKCRRAKGEQCNYCRQLHFIQSCGEFLMFLKGHFFGRWNYVVAIVVLTFQILKPKHEILKTNSWVPFFKKKTSTCSKLNIFTIKIAGKLRHVLKFPQPAVLPCLAWIQVLDQQQDQ